NSDSLRGMSFELANKARREELGSTSTCRTTRADYRDEWPSPGRPWTPSTRKTNESWVMPPTATIESTSGGPRVGLWSAIRIGLLPTANDRWFSTSPALPHGGTFHEPTSTSPR